VLRSREPFGRRVHFYLKKRIKIENWGLLVILLHWVAQVSWTSGWGPSFPNWIILAGCVLTADLRSVCDFEARK
jgi:hypothetical protein